MRRPLYLRHPSAIHFAPLRYAAIPLRWILAAVFVILFVLIATLGLIVAFLTADAAHHLPHREPWELYAQANSPGPHDCPPGTFPFYVDIPDSPPIFDQCMRSHEP